MVTHNPDYGRQSSRSIRLHDGQVIDESNLRNATVESAQ
jgi:hypothetical protein